MKMLKQKNVYFVNICKRQFNGYVETELETGRSTIEYFISSLEIESVVLVKSHHENNPNSDLKENSNVQVLNYKIIDAQELIENNSTQMGDDFYQKMMKFREKLVVELPEKVIGSNFAERYAIRIEYRPSSHNKMISFYAPQHKNDTHLELVGYNFNYNSSFLFPVIIFEHNQDDNFNEAVPFYEPHPWELVYILSEDLCIISPGNLKGVSQVKDKESGDTFKIHNYEVENAYADHINFCIGTFDTLELESGDENKLAFIPSQNNLMNINLEELSQDIQVMDKYMNCFLQKECGVQLKVVFTMQFNFCEEGSYNTYFMRSVKSHDSTSANRNITFINQHNSVESNRVVVGKNTAFIPIYVLPPNKDIDESFKFKYTTAELIVSQIAPIHFRSVDPWLSVGAHEYLIDVLLTQIFGRNDFLYNQRSDIDFVVENDIFEYSLADKRRTIKDINSLFFKKKSCQVYHMIEKYTSRAFMQKILSELIKEHEDSENEIHMHKIPESGNFKSHHKKILNTQNFLRLIKEITGKDLSRLFNFYVFKPGCIKIYSHFTVNKKINEVNLTIQQKGTSLLPNGNRKIDTPILVRSHEIEGIYDHEVTAPHKNETTRNKKSEFNSCQNEEEIGKDLNQHDENINEIDNDVGKEEYLGSANTSLGDNEFKVTNKITFNYHTRSKKTRKREEEEIMPLLFISIDPHILNLTKVEIDMPREMIKEQIQDRNVLNQKQAIEKTTDLELLEKTINDSKIFYKIRIEAAYKLTELDYQRSLSLFVKKFCFKRSTLVRGNDYGDISRYFIQHHLIKALGMGYLTSNPRNDSKVDLPNNSFINNNSYNNSFINGEHFENENSDNFYPDNFYNDSADFDESFQSTYDDSTQNNTTPTNSNINSSSNVNLSSANAHSILVAFFLNILRYNDNSLNEFDDSSYIASIVESLVNQLIIGDQIKETVLFEEIGGLDIKKNMSIDNPSFDKINSINDSECTLAKILKSIQRLIKRELIFPSFRNKLSVQILKSLGKLSLYGLLNFKKSILKILIHPENYLEVRLAAIEIFVLLYMDEEKDYIFRLMTDGEREIVKKILGVMKRMVLIPSNNNRFGGIYCDAVSKPPFQSAFLKSISDFKPHLFPLLKKYSGDVEILDSLLEVIYAAEGNIYELKFDGGLEALCSPDEFSSSFLLEDNGCYFDNNEKNSIIEQKEKKEGLCAEINNWDNMNKYTTGESNKNVLAPIPVKLKLVRNLKIKKHLSNADQKIRDLKGFMQIHNSYNKNNYDYGNSKNNDNSKDTDKNFKNNSNKNHDENNHDGKNIYGMIDTLSASNDLYENYILTEIKKLSSFKNKLRHDLRAKSPDMSLMRIKNNPLSTADNFLCLIPFKNHYVVMNDKMKKRFKMIIDGALNGQKTHRRNKKCNGLKRLLEIFNKMVHQPFTLLETVLEVSFQLLGDESGILFGEFFVILREKDKMVGKWIYGESHENKKVVDAKNKTKSEANADGFETKEKGRVDHLDSKGDKKNQEIKKSKSLVKIVIRNPKNSKNSGYELEHTKIKGNAKNDFHSRPKNESHFPSKNKTNTYTPQILKSTQIKSKNEILDILIERLIASPYSKYFTDPVNPSVVVAYKKIKLPLCLREMLRTEYSNLSELIFDLILIQNNCLEFNGNNFITEECLKMVREGIEMIKFVFDPLLDI